MMPSNQNLSITKQASILDAVPKLIQARDDVNALNFYRKPIMKEKSQV